MLKILKNRTFAKNLFWYNLSIKGGFTMNNTLFEQFGDIYMQVGEYMCFIGLLQKITAIL